MFKLAGIDLYKVNICFCLFIIGISISNLSVSASPHTSGVL